MSTVMRLGLVFLGFGAVLLLLPLADSSSDAETVPIAAVVLIVGVLLLLVGANRRSA